MKSLLFNLLIWTCGLTLSISVIVCICVFSLAFIWGKIEETGENDEK